MAFMQWNIFGAHISNDIAALYLTLYCCTLDNALLSTVEELQSALDRANEKLQFNNTLLKDKEKEISKLSVDVDTVSLLCCHSNGVTRFTAVIAMSAISELSEKTTDNSRQYE